MTAIRPSFPDKMVNPIYPPMHHPTTNGITSQNPSISTAQFNYQMNPPVFSITQQYQYNSTLTPPLPSSNIYNTNLNPTPPLINHYNPSLQPTVRPMYASPVSAYRPQVQKPQFIKQMPYQISQPPSSAYPYPYSNTAAAPIPTPT